MLIRYASGKAQNRLQRLALCRFIFFCAFIVFAGPSHAALPEKDAHADLEQRRPMQGDRIIFGVIGEASNLISCLATDSASRELSSQIFVSPLRYNKDLQLEPYAASSYEVLEDGKLLRFTLHPGIAWEDGTELTADDVEFTYKIVIDPATASPYAEDFMAIKSFTKTGRYSSKSATRATTPARLPPGRRISCPSTSCRDSCYAQAPLRANRWAPDPSGSAGGKPVPKSRYPLRLPILKAVPIWMRPCIASFRTLRPCSWRRKPARWT